MLSWHDVRDCTLSVMYYSAFLRTTYSCLRWFLGTGPAIRDVEQAASSMNMEKIAIVKMTID
jgi:hypothetical protein